MSWTTPEDLRGQVRRLWDRGLLPAALAGGDTIFPRRLVLKGPSSRELAERFDDVRRWIARLEKGAEFYRVGWRTVNHRILGVNAVPDEIWIDSLDDALGLIDKRRDAERFAALISLTRERRPELSAWLAKRPLRGLALADDWARLLDIVDWLRRHPRPDIYLRQVDVPGVHSKFIERHRAVLSELFDLVMPLAAVDASAGGIGGFCRRYGFRDKPMRVRFRTLDPDLSPFTTTADLDMTLTRDVFDRLALPVARVFITENEVNFLAFPPVSGTVVIFGAGYGFDNLAGAEWLRVGEIHYWGDIDTHGFAILNQLRRYFPDAASFLMDEPTLLAHRVHWGTEPNPETGDLERLTPEESALYDALRRNRWGNRIRLEQEKIGFNCVASALERLSRPD
ncbi:DUF3322 domain-containing protein [Desulfococcus multivorans]|uniref:Wadjet protein JetD C-terminal domain-containing protein n=1 Tax=Desulfococcus multivorans DSM 2059 TaxID=1121405 RepID=S7UYM5_DESML|nr:DUF3322 domain-containing protein [Desulfococcus multivorans]AOY57488.1 conserved uncharacterized protein [Desulfococcus multivorans]AQU99919.1 hypothetical protein B2D07_03420 [Desulfococcus multivorans]EPR39334.1 protein of unknown function DUF3322 [Desulfococcus multivorans DSM 2059]SKA12868.1 hypothetical protein SAMN02745446_02897 [Desulfococcus multivorans DSM 2059]